MGYECFFVFLVGHGTETRELAAGLLDHCPVPYCFHFAVGPWLKTQCEQSAQSLLGAFILNNWTESTLEPIATQAVDIMCSAFAEQNKDRCRALIISGYPRTVQQVKSLTKVCHGHYMHIIEVTPLTAELRQAIPPRCLAPLGKLHELTMQWLEDQSKMQRMIIPPQDPIVDTVLVPADAFEAAEVCHLALQLANATSMQRHFCGTQPISLLRQHLPRFSQYPFHVSLKIDGERFLCVVYKSCLWFISRTTQVYRSGAFREQLTPHNFTLLDGELVTANSHLFVVLDCIAVNGKYVGALPLMDRLEASVPVGLVLADGGKPWFRPQEYVPLNRLTELLAKKQDRPFALDGLVFTPSRRQYRLGIDKDMFKWKPTYDITADLLLTADHQFTARQQSNSTPVPMGRLLPPTLTGSIPRHGIVYECQLISGMDRANYMWRPLKPRPDKRGPNLDWICDSIVQSIRENITESELRAVSLSERPAAGRPP